MFLNLSLNGKKMVVWQWENPRESFVTSQLD